MVQRAIDLIPRNQELKSHRINLRINGGKKKEE